MPNITFIIGNGLDLSLGLHTKYSDFYAHIQNSKPTTKNRIYQAIRKDTESWADFEIQLGAYTKYIGEKPLDEREKESKAFHDELAEITDDLADYLQLQENEVDKLPDHYRFNGRGVFQGLPVGQRDKIVDIIQQSRTATHFVTLNYTKTLEKILEDEYLLSQLGWSATQPLHIHGDLFEDTTLGVSDETQLYEGMSQAEKDDLIKPTLIDSMNDGRLNDFRAKLQRTNILVFFGTSIGESDKYIWKIVNEWLEADVSRYVIIHMHDSTYEERIKRLSRARKLFTTNVQDMLLKFANKSDIDTHEMRNRIFVIHNSSELFMPVKRTSPGKVHNLN